MVKLKGQNIPSSLRYLYEGSLQPATFKGKSWTNLYNTAKYNQIQYRGSYYVRLRYPFRMISRQGRDDIHTATEKEIASDTDYSWRRKKKGTPSAAQLYVRNTFCKSAYCFGRQPETGGWDGVSEGPRGRDWWYALSLGTGLYYYPNFMSHTLTSFFGSKVYDWDAPITYKDFSYGKEKKKLWPHLFIKLDEAEFLLFYDDMASLYGWSWDANSDPDVIAHTMCVTVIAEIEAEQDYGMEYWKTPGETAETGFGDCEDLGMLMYAMIKKTLLDIGKTSSYIDTRLKEICYMTIYGGHVITGWKDNNDIYRALPSTRLIGSPGDSISDCKLLLTVIGNQGYIQFNQSKTQECNIKGEPVTPAWCYKIIFGVYIISDTYNRIHVTDKDGNFTFKWGGVGSGDGQFDHPRGVKIYQEECFVADTNNHRIQVFDTAGNYKRKWGTQGVGPGQLQQPLGVFIYSDEVFVTSLANNRVQVFDLDGVYKHGFGTDGSGDSNISYPNSICVYSNEVYIVDNQNQKVKVFSLSGAFKRAFFGYEAGDGPNHIVRGITLYNNELFTTDGQACRVYVFTTTGSFKRKWGTCASGPTCLNAAQAIAVHGQQVFVTTNSVVSVKVYDLLGNLQYSWGSPGGGDHQYYRPLDIDFHLKT